MLPPISVSVASEIEIGMPQASQSHSGCLTSLRRMNTCMTRTRIAVARPRAPGSRPPGSETSIQKRVVSTWRLCALSPA